MTKLSRPIARETAKTYGGLPVVVTLAPAGSQSEALIGLRLKGRRVQYVVALSDLYRMAALNYGTKLARAKKQARRDGVSWRVAKKQFDSSNRIP